MSKTIKISDKTHGLLKVESDKAGMTFDAFLHDVLENIHMTQYDSNQGVVRAHLDMERSGDKAWVLYSAFSRGEEKYHNLQMTAYEGKIRIYMPKGDGWEEGMNYVRKETYESEVLENPTWLDLCVVANDMILLTGDTHHRYLESLNVTQRNGGDLVAIGEFFMGS